MGKNKKEKIQFKVKNGKVKAQFVGTDNKKIKYEYGLNDRIWMICKINIDGEELLTIARDIDGTGWLDDNEVRIDDEYYTEEEGAERVQELSKELGIRAMTSMDLVTKVNNILKNNKSN